MGCLSMDCCEHGEGCPGSWGKLLSLPDPIPLRNTYLPDFRLPPDLLICSLSYLLEVSSVRARIWGFISTISMTSNSSWKIVRMQYTCGTDEWILGHDKGVRVGVDRYPLQAHHALLCCRLSLLFWRIRWCLSSFSLFSLFYHFFAFKCEAPFKHWLRNSCFPIIVSRPLWPNWAALCFLCIPVASVFPSLPYLIHSGFSYF